VSSSGAETNSSDGEFSLSVEMRENKGVSGYGVKRIGKFDDRPQTGENKERILLQQVWAGRQKTQIRI